MVYEKNEEFEFFQEKIECLSDNDDPCKHLPSMTGQQNSLLYQGMEKASLRFKKSKGRNELQKEASNPYAHKPEDHKQE